MFTPNNNAQIAAVLLHRYYSERLLFFFILMSFCILLNYNCLAQQPPPASIPNYISLNELGTPVCEDFNTLEKLGESSVLPSGWYIYESGNAADQLYTAGNGYSSKGDTYSFGSIRSSDRSLGSRVTMNFSASWGVKVYNNTGATLNSIKISFTGETWRVSSARRYDRIDFQYSTSANSLSSSSGWINVDALDYENEGKPRRGWGSLLHSQNFSFTIKKLSIPNNSFFWLKWKDADIQGQDDGMGIDDFCITPFSPCTAADAIEFLLQPADVMQDNVMSPVSVRAYCKDGGFTDVGYAGNVSLNISDGGCGFVSQTLTAIKGVAKFDNIRITRSAQTKISFTASAAGLKNVTSQSFNVLAPDGGGTPLPIANAGNDLEGCNGGPNSLNGSALNTVGNVSYLWVPAEGLDDHLSSTPIASNTSPQTYTLTVTDADGCKSSDEVNVNILSGPPGMWTGSVDQDWFNCRNWADGKVPSFITDVTISGGVKSPIISSSDAVVRNILFKEGSKLFMPNKISKLSVYGNFINNSGSDLDGQIDTGSTVVFKGDTAQIIGGDFVTTFQRLLIDNQSAIVSLNQHINVINQLLLSQDAELSLGDFDLTLKSFSTITANVGVIPEKAKINYNGLGRCIVERYINTGEGLGQHGKSWQFLATPILLDTSNNQTIKQSWQEGAEAAFSSSLISNPNPGYGTLITSNLGGSDAGARALGFDVYTRPGPTIKSWNGITQSWEGPSSTNIPVTSDKGYMIFVRGDRSVVTFDAAATTTTMRMRGKLHQPGINSPKRIEFNNEGFHSVGNPYASAIDFSKLNKTEGISNSFYVFDPTLKGTFGVGGYQTIVGALGYTPTPGSINDTSTLYLTGGDYRMIQSGQAFFVYNLSNTPQSITFKESDKINTSRLASRPAQRSISMLSADLFAMMHGEPVLADGNRVLFDNQFSNKVDGYDALKMKNGGENFGILRDGSLLAVDARQTINETDTIYYNLSGLREMDYTLMFLPSNMNDGLIDAVLIDEYMRTRVSVSMKDTVRIPFQVNGDADSRTEGRFKLVFSSAGPLPVEIIDITAIRNEDNHVAISWNIGYELNVDFYDLERSINGSDFEKIYTQRPSFNNGAGAFYSYIDECPLQGVSFYRIKAISDFGRVSYSNIVRVEDKVSGPSISVYPIPIEEGRLQVSLQNQHAGNYSVRMLNASGQIVFNNNWQLFAGNNTRFIQIDKAFSAGNYYLELISSEGVKQVVKVVVK